jgi:hypothetical protein
MLPQGGKELNAIFEGMKRCVSWPTSDTFSVTKKAFSLRGPNASLYVVNSILHRAVSIEQCAGRSCGLHEMTKSRPVSVEQLHYLGQRLPVPDIGKFAATKFSLDRSNMPCHSLPASNLRPMPLPSNVVILRSCGKTRKCLFSAS